MFNERFRQGSPLLNASDSTSTFSSFFDRVLALLLDPLSLKVKTILLTFLNHCFASLENPTIRSELLKLVNVGIWVNVVDQDTIDLHANMSEDRLRLWEKAQKKVTLLHAVGGRKIRAAEGKIENKKLPKPEIENKKLPKAKIENKKLPKAK
jgi:Intron-binding protein aquarius N-terminus